MKLRIAFAVIGWALASNAQAAFIQFSDRGDFEAATTMLTTETFNSVMADIPFGTTPADVGPFSISASFDSQFNLIVSNGSAPLNVDGTPFVSGIGFAGESNTFSFDMPITAFGVDLFGLNASNRERTRILIGGEEFQMPVVDTPVVNFFGVVSDTPFTDIVFSVIAGGEDAGYDNVSFGAATVPLPGATVPLPGTMFLLFGGLIGAGAVGRLRR